MVRFRSYDISLPTNEQIYLGDNNETKLDYDGTYLNISGSSIKMLGDIYFGANVVSGTGDVHAGYYYGDGSNITGLDGTHTHSASQITSGDLSINRISSALSNFGSNTISGTGNLYAGNAYISNKIGVGNTSPTAKVQISTGESSGSAVNAMRIHTTAVGSALDFYCDDSNASNRNWRIAANNATRGNLEFVVGTSQGADPSSYKMVIDSSGKVGIGTSSPVSLLTLVNTGYLAAEVTRITGGPAYFLGQCYNGTYASPTDQTAFGSVFMGRGYRNSDARAMGYMYILGDSGAASTGDGIKGKISFYTTNDDSTTTEKVTIKSSGNVGIGITSPNHLLEVNGKAKVLGFHVNITTKTAGYTLTVNDDVVIGNTSGASGDITFSLPAASTVVGKIYEIKRTAGSFNVIIDPNGSETVDGSSTRTLSVQWEAVTITSDGSNWYII